MSQPSLRELTAAVALDVNRTLGGGYPGIELLRRRFTSRYWLDARSHGLLMAVCRLTPGTNVLAYCVALGWRFHGWAGALAALLAGSIPASAIVFGLAVTLTRIDQSTIVRTVLAAGVLVASVLVISSAWNLLRPYLPSSRLRALAIGAVAAGLTFWGASPVRVLFACAVLNAALPPSADA
jgi:chromate transporter